MGRACVLLCLVLLTACAGSAPPATPLAAQLRDGPTATSTTPPTVSPTSPAGATRTILPTAVSTQAARAGTVGWSTGYYPGWQQPGSPPSAIPWDQLTHIVHFSVLTGPARDGSIDTAAEGLTPQAMTAAVTEAHNRGKKILLGLGGSVDNNWDAACDATNRAHFIGNVVGVLRQYGYDGLDLDIEQDWQSPAHPDYIACVAGFRAALDTITPRPLLTEPGDPDWQAYMLAQVWPYLDQINLMDYWRDAAGSAAGLDRYTAAGIPRALLGVGIGLNDGGIDGPNPADCAAKAQVAISGGYGGVMIWTVPADAILHGGQTPCLDALAPYVAAAPLAAPLPADTAPRCFAETRACMRSLFADYWAAHGGLAINGFPISEERAETLDDGRAYTVQYFERVRMEYQPENPPPRTSSSASSAAASTPPTAGQRQARAALALAGWNGRASRPIPS